MFKTVLAHLTGSTCDGSVLKASLALVSGLKGHIDCLRLLPDPVELIAESAQTDSGGWIILSDTIAAIEREASHRTRKAQDSFGAFAREKDIRKQDDPEGSEQVTIWSHEAVGDEFDQITRAGRYQDVIVLAGGRDREGRMAAEAPGGIVIAILQRAKEAGADLLVMGGYGTAGFANWYSAALPNGCSMGSSLRF